MAAQLGEFYATMESYIKINYNIIFMELVSRLEQSYSVVANITTGQDV